ncbi:MAG: YaaR family protein [Spirochaetales bacterium]|nr:YaaR family protein [Spirochaetales bacterium]
MDRIESLEAFQFSKPSERKKARKGNPSAPASFPAALESAGAESGRYDVLDAPRRGLPLEELLDAVHERGEALLDSQSLDNVRRYREAVRSFLDYVVKEMLEVQEKTSGASIARRKRFTQLRVIDEKLEQLVTGVLQNQQRQIELMDRINEIRGLLVDLIT